MDLMRWIIGPEAISTTEMVNNVPTYAAAMKGIAISHTVFNVANVLLFLPFTTFLANFLMRLVPDKIHKEVPHLRYLDVRMLDTPAVSIEQSKMEILRMAENVKKMLSRLQNIIVDNRADEKSENKIFHREEVLDIMQKEIVQFLSNLLSGTVPHNVMNKGRMQLRIADEYESMGDYITNILKLNLKMRKSGLKISEEGRKESLDLHERVKDYVSMVSDAVSEENPAIISKAQTLGDAITHFVKEYPRNILSVSKLGILRL